MQVKKRSNTNDPVLSAMSVVMSERNKSIPWVDRGLNPSDNPSMKNADGSVSTHRMAAEFIDGDWYVFPTIDYDKKSGKWIEFEDPFEAYNYHKQKGSLMKMPNKELALYYAENGLIKH